MPRWGRWASDVTCYVAVAPEARPPELDAVVGRPRPRARLGLDDVPPRRRARGRRDRHHFGSFRVGVAEAQDFGRIVATGYGLPDAVVPWAARAPEAGWDCWLALDGDEPAAAAGVFIDEGVGYLGFAATLPEHRGKGGQNALLAERIEHARASGCDVVVTETGELRDEPSLELVPQHPPRRVRRGRGARQLAPPGEPG